MLEETAVVTAVENQAIHVQTQIKTTCGGCQQNNNCGTGVIARAFAPKTEDIVIPYTGTVAVGQQVTLGIAENSLLQASALIYLLPLAVMIIAVMLAESILAQIGLTHEIWLILTAFFAAVVSFIGVRYYVGAQKQQYLPQLLSIVPPPIPVKNLSE
ncbi:SoxR reducing system RseC family protein [Alteromonadaceae bacterium BrNp21-10]|nr:SoxR reducing system RseC family protein [Alteromonadaceae bacterium BrNp21-10]